MNVTEVKEAIATLKKNLKVSKIVLPQYCLDELGIKTVKIDQNVGYISTNKLNIMGVSLESK